MSLGDYDTAYKWFRKGAHVVVRAIILRLSKYRPIYETHWVGAKEKP